MPRLFVALDLPPDVRACLSTTYYAMPGARWIDPDDLHLTLRFIGEVDQVLMDDIGDALRTVAGAPFELALGGVGYFPPRRKPNVLWVGASAGNDLVSLQARIERTLTRIGLEGERRNFHAHVTVARLSDEAPLTRIGQFMSSHSLLKCDPVCISEFHLYESRLSPHGAQYEKIESYSLDGYSEVGG